MQIYVMSAHHTDWASHLPCAAANTDASYVGGCWWCKSTPNQQGQFKHLKQLLVKHVGWFSNTVPKTRVAVFQLQPLLFLVRVPALNSGRFGRGADPLFQFLGHIHYGLLRLGSHLFDVFCTQVEFLEVDHADGLVVVGLEVVAQVPQVADHGHQSVVRVEDPVGFVPGDSDLVFYDIVIEIGYENIS